MSKETLISVKNIDKKYGDGTHAVRGVSFNIKKGEFVAIMGPSGSGKSTILHIIGLLDKKTSGTYEFDGKNTSRLTEEHLAEMRNKTFGFVFQTFNLLRKASVLENVKLPLLYSDVPTEIWDEKALKAIKAVGLEHRIENESMELSGGERQRVAIARALINDPDVIFADEPTGNLDSVSGKQVMDILKDLNEQGKTIVVITHEKSTAEYAKRVIELEDGKKIYDGPLNHKGKEK